MDRLPAEILCYIISLLDVKAIVSLLAVSKRVRQTAQDNELWRSICYERSFSERAHLRLSHSPSAPSSIQHQATAALSATPDDPDATALSIGDESHEPSNAIAKKIRAVANWDPSYPGERVNWQTEYISRYGPLSVSWLAPTLTDNRFRPESRGLGLYRSGGQRKVLAPLENGALCMWDVSKDKDHIQRGAISSCSKPGLLSMKTSSENGSSSRMESLSTGVVECIRVDSFRQKAYIAVQSSLSEVDLNTMQVSAYEGFPFSISAVSDADDQHPTTVGTTLSLHIYDARQPNNHRSDESTTARTDIVANFPVSPRQQSDFNRLLSGDDGTDYAPLFQPGPLSIHHLSSYASTGSQEIYVAGRFPSVLVYDRRTFPRLRTNFHSGARLCSLTSLPFSFRSLEAELMRKQQLSLSAVQEAKSIAGDRLIAVGDYKGKGSLEIYGLSPDRSALDFHPTQTAGVGQTSTFKNRVGASRSKLLSVTTHGTRLLVSDSDGNLRWFERDGFSLVRAWNINAFAMTKSNSVFSTSYAPMGSDVARKLVSLNQPGADTQIEDDEVLFWSGDRIGLLGFTSKPRFGGENGEQWLTETAQERLKSREERIYGETMRRALQRQADEVRVMQGLGLGIE